MSGLGLQGVLATQISSRGIKDISFPNWRKRSFHVGQGQGRNTHVVTAGNGTVGQEQRSSDFPPLMRQGRGFGWGSRGLPCTSEKVEYTWGFCIVQGDAQEQDLAEAGSEALARDMNQARAQSTAYQSQFSETSGGPGGRAWPAKERDRNFELGPSPQLTDLKGKRSLE